MRTKSKSQIITSSRRASTNDLNVANRAARRLPRDRPPTHPGQMLIDEFLRPHGISQTAFAIQLGISFSRLNEIVRAKRSVTADVALRLERVLGMPADFWLGLQSDWDLWHAKRNRTAADIARLKPLDVGS
jgi:antitoxin HigA-1